MAGYSYFVCPVEFNNDANRFQVDCEPSDLFQLQDYVVPAVVESFTGWVSIVFPLPRAFIHPAAILVLNASQVAGDCMRITARWNQDGRWWIRLSKIKKSLASWNMTWEKGRWIK